MSDAEELPPIDDFIFEITEDLMKFDVDSELWDQHPMLYLVCAPVPELTGDRYRVHLFDLTDRFWGMGPDVPALVRTLGIALGVPNSPPPPVNVTDGEVVLAVVFRHEGWGVVSGSGISQEELMEYAANGGRFVDHPQRTEVKLVHGMTDNITVSRLHEREGAVTSLSTDGEGRLDEAMRAVLVGARKRWAGPDA